jgi:hypothetical protein
LNALVCLEQVEREYRHEINKVVTRELLGHAQNIIIADRGLTSS